MPRSRPAFEQRLVLGPGIVVLEELVDAGEGLGGVVLFVGDGGASSARSARKRYSPWRLLSGNLAASLRKLGGGDEAIRVVVLHGPGVLVVLAL